MLGEIMRNILADTQKQINIFFHENVSLFRILFNVRTLFLFNER